MKTNEEIRAELLAQEGIVIDLNNTATGESVPNAIYITDDPHYNKLTLTIQNNTDEAIEISKAASLKISPQGLSPEEIKGVHIRGELDERSIQLKSKPDEDGDDVRLAIWPHDPLCIQNSQALKIHFDKLVATDKDTKHRWSVTIGGQPLHTDMVKLVQQDAPSLLDDVAIGLICEDQIIKDPMTDQPPLRGGHGKSPLGAHIVYICGTTSDCTDELKDNALIVCIKNTKSNALCPDATQQQASNAKFIISFPHVDNNSTKIAGALCNSKGLGNVTADVGEQPADHAWQVTPDATSWTFYPVNGNKTLLGGGEAVHFALHNIVSHLQPGLTYMQLSWHNIPGYNDGSKIILLIKKSAQPTVKQLALSRPEGYTAYVDPYNDDNHPAGVHFNYMAYGAEEWELKIAEKAHPKQILAHSTGGCSLEGTIPVDPNLPPGNYQATLSPKQKTQ